MQWEIFLIPLLAVIIIILSTVFGGDKKKKPRESPTELDDYLEETRTRRAKDQPVQTVTPTEPPRSKQKKTKRPKPTPTQTPRKPLPTVPVESSPIEPPSTEVGEDATPPIEIPKRLAPRRQPSPVLRQVREMLRHPNSVQTAFVLNEIFQGRRGK